MNVLVAQHKSGRTFHAVGENTKECITALTERVEQVSSKPQFPLQDREIEDLLAAASILVMLDPESPGELKGTQNQVWKFSWR